jgi:hypothetical protein
MWVGLGTLEKVYFDYLLWPREDPGELPYYKD